MSMYKTFNQTNYFTPPFILIRECVPVKAMYLLALSFNSSTFALVHISLYYCIKHLETRSYEQ